MPLPCGQDSAVRPGRLRRPAFLTGGAGVGSTGLFDQGVPVGLGPSDGHAGAFRRRIAVRRAACVRVPADAVLDRYADHLPISLSRPDALAAEAISSS